jgi:hypothetical protein
MDSILQEDGKNGANSILYTLNSAYSLLGAAEDKVRLHTVGYLHKTNNVTYPITERVNKGREGSSFSSKTSHLCRINNINVTLGHQ